MKYIRTKDGIYKYVKKIRNYYYECDNFIDDEKKVHCFIIFKPKDILKQADTIEELIMIGDLVFKTTGEIYEITNQFYIDCYIKQKCIKTLFIKDNKGNYIRVAEKNDKGELELL